MESMELDEDFLQIIQEITKKISKASNSDTEVLLTDLEDAVASLQNIILTEEGKETMRKCGIDLWNVGVGKSIGKNDLVTVGRLRDCALSMVHSVTTRDTDYPLLFKMALSTAKSWLYCEYHVMAGNTLQVANEILDKKPEVLGTAEDISDHKFAIFLHLALCAFKEEKDSEIAREYVKKAASLSRTSEQKRCLTLQCYNFGVESCNSGDCTTSSAWLEKGIELGKTDKSISSCQQAKSLRLWANNLMHLRGKENLEKAENVVNMANEEDLCANGIILKIRILLCQSDMDKATLSSAIEKLAGVSDLILDTALSAVSLLQLKKMYEHCCDLLVKLLSRFCTSLERNRLLIRKAEVLLEMQKAGEAEQIIRNLVNGNENLEDSVSSGIKDHCWKMARNLMKENVNSALLWLDLALPLFKGNSDVEFHSEFLRLKGVCLIDIGNLDQALETAKIAESQSGENLSVLLLLFKLTLMIGDSRQAKKYFQNILENSSLDDDREEESSDTSDYVVAAAKVALEINKDVAIECLEQYLAHVQDPSGRLTILKCLVRLCISEEVVTREDGKRVLPYLKSALEALRSLKTEDVQWFMKVAWNLALKNGEEPNLAYEFYIACFEFSALCDNGRTALIQQKRCLLLAAAAAIESAKNENVEFTKRQILTSCLEHIQSCRKICQELSMKDSAADISTPVLLMLYEFEVCLALNDPRVEQVLENAISLPQTEPKTFEILADLVMEYRPSLSALAARSLKVAIKKQLQQSEVDFNKCSKTFHTLIELALRDQTGHEQAWGYYMDVLEVLDNMAQNSYPEIEVLWLLSRAWNCGIQLYREMKFTNVLDWLEVAMRLVTHLTTFKEDYDQKLKNLYQQVERNISNTKNCDKEDEKTRAMEFDDI